MRIQCFEPLIFASLLGLASFTTVWAARPAAPTRATGVAQNYGKLPISFEANRGQTDTRVKFIAHVSGYGLYLTAQEAVLAMHGPAVTTGLVRMQLSGASPLAQSAGIDPLSGTANYLIGNDPSKWETSIPTYSKVQFSGVYPGVDVVYYGDHTLLEFDFVVAPHADPKAIHLHFEGASKIALMADGDLSISSESGPITFHKPEVYQQTNGNRQPIEGRFTLSVKNTVSFSLGRYDQSRPLIIDPVLVYSTYLGGSRFDEANAIAVDASGNAYVGGGYTQSADFPVTTGAFQTTNKGANAFVTKLNSTGTALVYSTYLGGSHIDVGYDIALDGSGDAYVTGNTSSPDFPVTKGAFQTTLKNDQSNAFVTKLNPTGTAPLYSTFLGGSGLSPGGGDYSSAIAVDSAGSAYVAGNTASKDFPVTARGFQITNKSRLVTAFLTKLDLTGATLVYSTYLGGSGGGLGDLVFGIALDDARSAYVTGYTTSPDFPVTPGAFQTKPPNQGNAFVTKFDPAGAELLYSTFLGGSEYDQGAGIAVDGVGNSYVVGLTQSTDFPVTPGAFETTNTGGTSGEYFVTQLNATGTALLYSTYLVGGANLGNGGISVDAFGSAYVAGSTTSTELTVTADAFQKTNIAKDGPTGFVAKLNLAPTTAPEFTPPPGKYAGSIVVMMSDATAGATIHYTLNGSIPTLTSPLYTEPIILPIYTVVRAIAFSSDFVLSPIVEGAYSPIKQTPTPVISPASGSYPAGQLITITDANPKATLRYTTDGSTPTTKSIWYDKPFPLKESETINAIAISTGEASSEVASATYAVP